jgi:hypothetical protein
MYLFLITLFLIITDISICQSKILYTYIDNSQNEVRAAMVDEDGTNNIDLGFNKTFLPTWMNEKIILSSQNFIWMSDTNGYDMKKIGLGYRASVSYKEDKLAFYNKDGIIIYDSIGKFLKQIEIEPWFDVSITWLANDSCISYYELKNQACKIFNLCTDSIWVFGDYIYHPVWCPKNNWILFNKQLEDGIFAVFYTDKFTNDESSIQVSKNGEMCVVPIWSNDGEKIAYLRIKPDSLQNIETDMFISDLIMYDVKSDKQTVLTNNAGFTDQAFPQICFDDTDENIYFTSLNENGTGSLSKINLNTMQATLISINKDRDERLPHFRNFQKKNMRK